MPEPMKKSKRGLFFSATIAALISLIIAAGLQLDNATERHIGSPLKPKHYTQDELSLFTGQWRGRILIGCMGQVFDVTSGRRHYGKRHILYANVLIITDCYHKLYAKSMER